MNCTLNARCNSFCLMGRAIEIMQQTGTAQERPKLQPNYS